MCDVRECHHKAGAQDGGATLALVFSDTSGSARAHFLRKKYGKLRPTMGQECHWPPPFLILSSPFLPFTYHFSSSSEGGARPALLSTTSPGPGAWAGWSPCQRHQREVSGVLGY